MRYRNRIIFAREWQRMLEKGELAPRAGLACKLGVTRAHVTQILGFPHPVHEVSGAVVGVGDRLSNPVATERSLRPPLKLPAEELVSALVIMVPL